MWDADLVARIRDRKLNEIMIFASMAKIDSGNVDTYIDIIVSLGDDIDACDTLLDTLGEAEIELDAIDAPEYAERLSPSEREDEDRFNSMKAAPIGVPDQPDIEEYVRGLISDAVESLRPDNSSDDAISSLKDELSGCRARVEQLTQQLDYSRTENATLEDELREVTSDRDEVRRQADELRSSIASLKTDLQLAEEKLSVLEPAYQEAMSRISELESSADAVADPVEEVVGNNPDPEVVPEAEAEEDPVEPMDQQFLTNGNMDSVRRVRDMKESKIDSIVEAAMDGKMDMDVCDDIIEFLKDDIAICDAILQIDFDVTDSVISGFKEIMRIATDSPDPKHQEEYTQMLTPDESIIEYNYAQVLNSLQGMMMYMSDSLRD